MLNELLTDRGWAGKNELLTDRGWEERTAGGGGGGYCFRKLNELEPSPAQQIAILFAPARLRIRKEVLVEFHRS